MRWLHLLTAIGAWLAAAPLPGIQLARAAEPDDRACHRAEFARSAILRSRQRRRHRREHVREHDRVRFDASHPAEPGGVVDAARSAHLGNQAAPGHRVPRRHEVHRRRCRVLAAACARCAEQSGTARELRAPGEADRDRRSAHAAHSYRPADAAADGPDRAHLHRAGEARRRGDQRGFFCRPRDDRHRAVSLQAGDAGRSRGGGGRTLATGARSPHSIPSH